MPRRKIAQKKQNIVLQNAFKKPEFWIGLLTVFVLLGVGLYVGLGQFKKMSWIAPGKEKIVSPVPLTQIKGEPTPTPSVTLSRQVKKLADTSGVVTTVALAHDNFWNISVRICGKGQYYKTIQTMNGYDDKSLQAGDVITIFCW